jgi:hypothetical protein
MGSPATLSKRSGRKRGGNEEESWEKGSRGRGGWAAPRGLMTLCSPSLARAPGGSQRGNRPIAADCAKSGTLKLLRAVELFQGRVLQTGCGLVLLGVRPLPSCICTTSRPGPWIHCMAFFFEPRLRMDGNRAAFQIREPPRGRTRMQATEQGTWCTARDSITMNGGGQAQQRLEKAPACSGSPCLKTGAIGCIRLTDPPSYLEC